MGKIPDNDIKILIDADVIIHFVAGDFSEFLHQIYPGRIVLLDKVKDEVTIAKKHLAKVQKLLDVSGFEENKLNDFNDDVKTEYAKLKSRFGWGDGESAIMAIAKFGGQYITSSNIKDIHDYCYANKIKYATTMDLLIKGVELKLFSDVECDEFIRKVKASGSRLPVNTIAEYRLLP